jgi:hypothetical protein
MSRKVFGVEWPQKCSSNADLETVLSAPMVPLEMSNRVPVLSSPLPQRGSRGSGATT